MRAQVFAHSCLVMCVPASHILMHSALLSSMALLLVRVAVSGAAGRALAGGAGAMVAVWAATAPALKTSIVDITGMRMAIPREAVVSRPSATAINLRHSGHPHLALASDDDVCKARRLGPSTAAAVSVN